MGTCHEFGPSIQAGCDHPMRADRPDACTCVECGVVCHGKFVGCPTVWARGPQAVHWKPAGPDPGLAARATPQAAAQMPAPDLPGVDEMASAIRRLVAEVAGLRQDLDAQRATVEGLMAHFPPQPTDGGDTPSSPAPLSSLWQDRTA